MLLWNVTELIRLAFASLLLKKNIRQVPSALYKCISFNTLLESLSKSSMA
jgi:hypothetical protein